MLVNRNLTYGLHSGKDRRKLVRQIRVCEKHFKEYFLSVTVAVHINNNAPT